jgi:MGT family glycosyltransferase
MAKYIFLNVPAWGHVNPTLAVVQELVKRGHEVSYYLTEEFRETIEATGAVFQPYESASKQMRTADGGADGAGTGPVPGRGPMFMLEDMRYVPPQVLERIRAEQPDVILYDFMCTWAHVVIDALLVPAIALRATYASNGEFDLMEHMRASVQDRPEARAMLERMRAFQGAQPGSSIDPMAVMFKVFSHAEQLNIIFLPPLFQPMAETFDERYVFVGPSILPRHQVTAFPFEKLDNELPLVYISMGTVANRQLEFYRCCFEAFREQPWQVVLSVGKSTDVSQFGPVPANFLLSSYVPQLDILPRTQVFVTHAGTNSLMESLYYGVPMVLIPQQPEQQMHARRAVELGLGVQLDKEAVSGVTLREAVECVARNGEYRERAQSMQQVIRESGGYQRAADAIVQFTREHVKTA